MSYLPARVGGAAQVRRPNESAPLGLLPGLHLHCPEVGSGSVPSPQDHTQLPSGDCAWYGPGHAHVRRPKLSFAASTNPDLQVHSFVALSGCVFVPQDHTHAPDGETAWYGPGQVQTRRPNASVDDCVYPGTQSHWFVDGLGAVPEAHDQTHVPGVVGLSAWYGAQLHTRRPDASVDD